MSTEPEDRPEALRAKLVELQAHQYHLDCERPLIRARMKVIEARLGDRPAREIPAFTDEEHSARHDAVESATALRRATTAYAEVLERCRALAAEEADRVGSKEST